MYEVKSHTLILVLFCQIILGSWANAFVEQHIARIKRERFFIILFSSNELLKFAIEILTSEYESKDIEVTDINYNIDHSTFNFKINNSINKIGFLVNLNTSQDRPNDFDLNDYSDLIKNSIKQNYIPRLATATFWEFEKKGYCKKPNSL